MKQHYCFLEKFNNYFNRKIIKYDSLLEYQNNSKSFFIPVDSQGAMLPFDFNPNDNVMTEIIANEVPFDPDYFLLLDDEQNIVQRWFVMEQKRNRKGQWLYTLRRDVVSDNLDNLEEAPIFVEKGMLPEDDPMVLNDEGMSFNQIKKNEYLLKDKSKSAWIACYLAKSLIASDVSVSTPADEEITDYVTLLDIANDLGISEAILADNINMSPDENKLFRLTNSITLRFLVQGFNFQDWYNENYSSDMSALNSSSTSGQTTYLSEWLFGGIFYPNVWQSSFISHRASLIDQMPTVLGRNYYLRYATAYQVIDSYKNKVVLYQGKYYLLQITNTGNTSTSRKFIASTNSAWAQACYDAYDNYNSSSGTMQVTSNETGLRLALVDVAEANKTYDVNISSGRKTCNNQEFDLVLIPASDINILNSGTTIRQSGDLAQKIASALAIKEGTNIYDVQLLPYCPFPNLITADNTLEITDLTENTDFNFIVKDPDGDNENVGVIVYVEQASFITQIDLSLTLVDDMKIDSNCDFYRLVSPNYQGSFDFNVARNGGTVEFFSVYCTYKPYTPFIKVTPNLQYVYGSDYNDNRGLICGGDFSLPRASSAWQQYQLENKNYQNIFNRDIQHLDFMQSIEMRNQIVSGGVGIVADTAKGAGAGAYVGGPTGALVGGLIGGATSAIGYGIDVDTLSRTQREIKQLSIDKFNYQLGNIKALPYTLTKVGAFDISSKIFPILEYYSCSDVERQALKNKIKYESMTVMRIGTLSEFMNFNGELNYFKGLLIRNDEIADDPHILNAIYEELLKGVYI